MVQIGGGCPIHRNIQGRVGWGSEEPDLTEVNAKGLDYMISKGLIQLRLLWFIFTLTMQSQQEGTA